MSRKPSKPPGKPPGKPGGRPPGAGSTTDYHRKSVWINAYYGRRPFLTRQGQIRMKNTPRTII